MAQDKPGIARRRFLQVASAALAVGPSLLSGLACARAAETSEASKELPKQSAAAPGEIRVASVSTAIEGGVLPSLIESFRKKTGLKVVLTKDDDLYEPAKEGKYDLLISHFGHRDAEDFIMGGFGLWPRTVFSNQLCLFGPPSDPAKVRGERDLVKAFGRIAKAKAPYVVNETRGIKYLTEILWNAVDCPAKNPWLIDAGTSKKDAVAFAAERGAYVTWGLTPFLHEQKASRKELVPLVTADPLLQRIMVSIVVNPEKFPGANTTGASEFQKFLLAPQTQARILRFHYPGEKHALWAPAGRHNAGAALPT